VSKFDVILYNNDLQIACTEAEQLVRDFLAN